MGIDPVSRPAVFLDRDGVLNVAHVRNGRPHPPARVDELVVPADVPAALDLLRRGGFVLVVVTNQPDVARGTQEQSMVEAINAELGRRLFLSDFRVCYHDDRSQCDCRKPAAGLLLSAAKELGLDLTRSFMIGDRWRDVEAGRRAGCRTVLIDHHYQEDLTAPPDARVCTLFEAAAWVLAAAALPRRN
jgi:D-glycero-D-manno-heptose 1,7-bisphosphate phosphatase